jgi:hypothetical protein
MSRHRVGPDRFSPAGWESAKLLDWILFGIFAAVIVIAATDIAPDLLPLPWGK